MSYRLNDQPTNLYEVDIKNKFVWLEDIVSRDSILKTLNGIKHDVTAVGFSTSYCDFNLNLSLYYLPFYFIDQSRLFINHSKENVETKTCFNFMVNKKMLHRYLVMRLINFFNLSSFDYTYSGSCPNIDDQVVLQELDAIDPFRKKFPIETISAILGANKIQPKFLGIDNFNDIAVQNSRIPKYGDILTSWKIGLDKIFSESAISLVTESDVGNYDKTCTFSEKTVYALLGLTIPIWPGGYKNAEEFSHMGFDIFDDIVDHGYQHESTLFMRCYRAINDNLHLLNDLEHAKSLREQIMPRLLKNRDHLFSQDLISWYRERIDPWPGHIKQFIFKKYPLLEN